MILRTLSVKRNVRTTIGVPLPASLMMLWSKTMPHVMVGNLQYWVDPMKYEQDKEREMLSNKQNILHIWDN